MSVVFLSSCYINTKIQIPPQDGLQGYQRINPDTISNISRANKIRLNKFEIINTRIQNFGELKWGLAMSGGGIRSASVNIGVLKALYDMNFLDSIDVISSVSGGSYAAGWFFTNEILNESGIIGKSLFDSKHILKNISHLQDRANMFRTTTMLGTMLTTPNAAFNKYKYQISRTFLSESLANRNLSNFQKPVTQNKIPQFIINSTVSSENGSDWLSRVYEYTTFYRGNPEIGFQKIDSSNEISIDEAITISAAALKCKLLRKTSNYSAFLKAKYIPLSDGGHSENLGAISLIRRGVKNIIVVDAEYNKNYSFDAYKILKEKLKEELSMDLLIPSIDSFISHSKEVLSTSVHKGSIKSIYIEPEYIANPLKINIYYIKMSLPNSLQTALNNEDICKNGCIIQNEILKCENSSETRCNFSSIIKQKDDFYNLSIYWVKSYSDWLNNHSKWRYLKYKFPHTPTSDQSFYRDQFAAFVGLGYIEALELKSLLLHDY